MTYFVLRAHTSQHHLHGKTYEFAMPLFTTTIGALQDKGLFISISDVDEPRLRAYLFLSTTTFLNWMAGWGDQKQCIDRITEFAEQNVAQFERLVLNAFEAPEVHLTSNGKPRVRETENGPVHVYTLAPVSKA